jgi:hypothetical protein
MCHSVSMDLRSRVLAVRDEGLPDGGGALWHGAATAIRWNAQRGETGGLALKHQGGDICSTFSR